MTPAKDRLEATPYYNELREAMAQTGCPLCRLLDQAANVQIDSMLWEMVNNPAIQEKIQQSRGYCRHHGWMMVRSGAALGITILMQAVFDTLLEVLDHHEHKQTGQTFQQIRHSLGLPSGGATARLTNQLSPQAECPICMVIKPIETGYTSTFVKHMAGANSLAPGYQQSDGLCLPHLQQVIKSAGPGKALEALLAAQQQIWERLRDHLAEFIRKNDYRFTHEPIGIEGDAWQRALESLYGPAPKTPGQGEGLTSGLTR